MLPTRLDIHVDRQIVRPGDTLTGTVAVNGDASVLASRLVITLQGEELLGANNFTLSVVTPVASLEKVILGSSRRGEEPKPLPKEPVPFSFDIPSEGCPPSYASADVRCQYWLKGRLEVPGAKDVIRKVHLTMVPAETPPAPEAEALTERGPLRARLVLDRNRYGVGDPVRGYFSIERDPDAQSLSDTFHRLDVESVDAPHRVRLALVARETSLLEDYEHQKVVWSESQDVPLDMADRLHVVGEFEFGALPDGFYSWTWNSFAVEWAVDVTFEFKRAWDLKMSVPFQVHRPGLILA